MLATVMSPSVRRLRNVSRAEAMPLAFWQRRHMGQTVLLLGKGPSLEAFLRDPAPLLAQAHAVGCINESITLAPEFLMEIGLNGPPVYHFANDPCDRWVEAIPPGIRCMFSCSRLLHDRTIDPLAPAAPICLFFDHHAVNPAIDDPLNQPHPITLGIGPSTAVSAFQILRLMGFARVIVVGLDGQGGYVREWSGPFEPHYYRDHREARLACEALGRAWQWDVDWSASGPTPV